MYQVSLTSSQPNIEPFEQMLLACGALSVTLQDAGDTPVLEPAPGETPVWPRTMIVALFDDESAAVAARQRLAGEFEGVIDSDTAMAIERLPDRNWSRVWMDDFKPMRFGERLWICPGSHQPPQPAAVNILLDPGLAFGSGTHPTTALCLEWLEHHCHGGERIIDYGCGSGVLTIAALKLGARHASAVDIDPQALLATRENATRNGIVLSTLDVLHPDQLQNTQVDLLLANILAAPLSELAPRFAALVKPGGRIVLAGILREQIEQIRQAYAADFDLVAGAAQDEWALLQGRRRTANTA